MRTLHCVPSMTGGGAERQLTYLVTALVQARWDVHVILVHGGPNLERLSASGATIHRLRGRGNHDPRLFSQLVGALRAVRPDLVHCWLLQMEILGGLAASLTGTPWVLSERSSDGAYPPTWKNRLRVRTARLANAIVSNSVAGERYWETRSGPRVARYVIPNAVPLDEIAAAPRATGEETGLPPEASLVLSAGRMDEGKNVGMLIEAMALIEERSIQTVCCGDGPLRSRLHQLIAERGLVDRVRLAGYISELWSWMKRANVLVSTSRFEGRPNVILEAMACGCPLVVSDIAAHREILDDGCAVFVNPDDPRNIADAIRSVLNNPAGAEERAARARARVAQFSTAAIALEYMAVYREVVAGRARNRAGGAF